MASIERFLATQYTRCDRLILRVFVFPVSICLLGVKWYVVDSIKPFTTLSLLDFLRMNLAYFALIVLWCALLLRKSASLNVFRIVSVAYFLALAAESLLSTTEIIITGAQIPLSVALYGMLSVGISLAPLQLVEAFWLYVIPGFVVGLFLAKWHLLSKSVAQNFCMPKLGVQALVVGILVLALLPPLHPNLERSTSRPSYFHKVIEGLRQAAPLDESAASVDASPPSTVSLVIRRGEAKRLNLVFIVLESVGARATGLGSPDLAGVTPNLQLLANSSLVYDRAYTVVPHTSKALVAMLCGAEPFYRYPIFESHLGIPTRCLASLLSEYGYETAFFQSPSGRFENRRGLVAQMGFQTFVGGEDAPSSGFELVNYFGYEDAVMLEPNRQWLETRTAPFFAVYLTGSTHHPYWAPTRLGFRQFVVDGNDREKNRYLNSVHYVDWFIDQLLHQFKAAGLYDDTIFVIVGDHGETFGKKTRRQHNASLYEETFSVPLLIHSPKRLTASRDSRVVSLVDIMPSIADLMGFNVGGPTTGRSFVGNAPHRENVIGSCWYDNWCLASVDERFKYIFNFDEKSEELYDLRMDPNETENLAGRYPDLVVSRRDALVKHHKENLMRYDRFYRNLYPNYWSSRGDSVRSPAILLSLPDDDPRRKFDDFR